MPYFEYLDNIPRILYCTCSPLLYAKIEIFLNLIYNVAN